MKLPEPQTVSIIGGRGKMGSMFADAFKQMDYTVLVSNQKNTNNIELAQQGDVVIVSVPLQKTEEVVREIGPYLRKEALLTDFTSVKMKPVAAMLQYSQAEVIGGHPLFGPEVDMLEGQNMILCPARGKENLSWYKSALESLGLKVTFMNPEEHDRSMAVMQCLTHFSNLAFAYALTKMDQEHIQQDVTTPAYLLRLYASARMLSQDPSLYTAILSENPFTEDAVRTYGEAVKEVSALVRGEKAELEKMLGSLKREFKDHPALRRKRVRIIDG